MRTDRVVIVTGAAGGIGRPVVERFLANGDRVIAVDINGNGLARLGACPKLVPITADITKEADCQTVVGVAREQAGRVDVLLNIAGWYPIQPFYEVSVDDFRKVVDVNLMGAFLMIRAVWPLMKGHGWGRIINTGSGSTFEGVPDQLHYVSAKAGLFGFTRSFARIAGNEGVTVNIVTPGLTSTAPVNEHVPKEMIKKATEMRVFKREELARDLVGAFFFLASPDADFITAQTVNVDGGAHML